MRLICATRAVGLTSPDFLPHNSDSGAHVPRLSRLSQRSDPMTIHRRGARACVAPRAETNNTNVTGPTTPRAKEGNAYLVFGFPGDYMVDLVY